MLSKSEARRLLSNFANGEPPPSRQAAQTLAGMDSLIDEWRGDLGNYIRGGGSLLRIVVAPTGSGKTHLGRALRALAAERSFLVCQIDEQSAASAADDLAFYRAFCGGLTVPQSYLGATDGEPPPVGLQSVIEDIASRCTEDEVRRALKPVQLPMPHIGTVLADAVGAVRKGELADRSPTRDAWAVMIVTLGGCRMASYRSLAALRTTFGERPFASMRRLPGKRDARLWMESLLLALPRLGYSGVAVVVDEHDEERQSLLDASIRQLRRTLDRLAEGHLPGVFVLYLVLGTFPDRITRSHQAVEQRTRPILPGIIRGRIMTELPQLRDEDGPAFLAAVGTKLYSVVFGDGTMPTEVEGVVRSLAKRHVALHGPDTRAFVQAFSQVLLERLGSGRALAGGNSR